jgi:GNAT superfamily N-acetyltransferase
MTDDERLHEVLIASRHAFVPMPDTRVIERPGWMQLVTPSLPEGGLNEVCLAVLSPAAADAAVDDTIAGYRGLGLRFRWSVGPDSAPHDLATRLAARGLVPEVLWGMARPLDGREPVLPPGLDIEPVDEHNLHDFTTVMARGWDTDPAPLLALHRQILTIARARVPMQLARRNGEPAGAAAMTLLPRSAYLMGAVVLPEHRGRGLYRALVSQRLREAARHGRTLATSQARARTSHPILGRLGFREVCRVVLLADPYEP